MQFLLFKSKNILDSDEINKIREQFNDTSSILCDCIDYEWQSSDKKSYFIGRNPKLEIYEKYDVFNIDTDNNLSFIHGWIKKDYEDFLLDSKSLIDFKDVDGFFNACIIDNLGCGKICSSKLHPCVYYAESKDGYAVSNRISCLSKVFNYNQVNKKYVALHIQYQSSAINFETMFENIYQVPFSSEIIVGDKLVLNKVHDYLYDERLHNLYLNDKNAYWDECFKKMYSQVKAFVNLGVSDKFILGISGGKDSRLLLALYHEFINSTFTWGSVFSPEMIVGKMVSDTVGLEHTFNKNNVIDNNSVNLIESLPQHLFVREFEMCPWDFGVIPLNIKQMITVDGQEYVRVKPLNEQDKGVIHDLCLKGLENNYAIVDEYNDLIRDSVMNYVDEYLYHINNPSKFSIIKRQLERGRWVSKVHETIFDHSFNIYPLLTNVALTYRYNISEEAMNLEEFHYELMKRSYPKLLNVPFFEDQFALNPIPSIENKIPGKLNYKNVYLVNYFDYIMDFINNNYSLISDVVKEDFLNNLTKEKIFNNSKLSQIIYNILQYIILIKNSNYGDLKNKLDLNWSMDIKKIDNSFFDDLLKAYVEYNKDIVYLKKRVNSLNHRINENLFDMEKLENNLMDKDKVINELSNQVKLLEKDFLSMNEEELNFVLEKNQLINNDKIDKLTKDLKHEKNKNLQTKRYLLFLENSLINLDNLNLELNNLKDSYACLEKVSDDKSSTIEFLNYKIEKMSSSIELLSNEIDKKSDIIKTSNQNIDFLENQSNELSKEKIGLIKTIENQNKQINELQEIISNLNNDIINLNNKIVKLNEDNSEYKNEIDELKSSNSWKVTQPIRNMKNIFKED